MGAMVARVVAWLGTWFAAGVANKVLTYGALKILLTGLMFFALPVVLNTFIYKFIAMSLDMINNATDGSGVSGIMQFSGFMAWLLECFRIPECIAVFVSALQIRLILKMIPFSPVR